MKINLWHNYDNFISAFEKFKRKNKLNNLSFQVETSEYEKFNKYEYIDKFHKKDTVIIDNYDNIFPIRIIGVYHGINNKLEKCLQPLSLNSINFDCLCQKKGSRKNNYIIDKNGTFESHSKNCLLKNIEKNSFYLTLDFFRLLSIFSNHKDMLIHCRNIFMREDDIVNSLLVISKSFNSPITNLDWGNIHDFRLSKQIGVKNNKIKRYLNEIIKFSTKFTNSKQILELNKDNTNKIINKLIKQNIDEEFYTKFFKKEIIGNKNIIIAKSINLIDEYSAYLLDVNNNYYKVKVAKNLNSSKNLKKRCENFHKNNTHPMGSNKSNKYLIFKIKSKNNIEIDSLKEVNFPNDLESKYYLEVLENYSTAFFNKEDLSVLIENSKASSKKQNEFIKLIKWLQKRNVFSLSENIDNANNSLIHLSIKSDAPIITNHFLKDIYIYRKNYRKEDIFSLLVKHDLDYEKKFQKHKNKHKNLPKETIERILLDVFPNNYISNNRVMGNTNRENNLISFESKIKKFFKFYMSNFPLTHLKTIDFNKINSFYNTEEYIKVLNKIKNKAIFNYYARN